MVHYGLSKDLIKPECTSKVLPCAESMLDGGYLLRSLYLNNSKFICKNLVVISTGLLELLTEHG